MEPKDRHVLQQKGFGLLSQINTGRANCYSELYRSFVANCFRTLSMFLDYGELGASPILSLRLNDLNVLHLRNSRRMALA